MASIAEILTLLLILSCILILPRMLKQENKEEKTKLNPRNFSIYHRFAIFISVMLPVIMALLIKPWKTDLILFIFVGVLPVAVLWGIIWMAAGFKK